MHRLGLHRIAQVWLLCASLLLFAQPGRADSHSVSVVSPTGCSVYMGQAVLNELRIGYSGKSSTSNQIEIYNSGNVSAAVWQTWQLVVYYKSGSRISKKGGYYLSSGFTANGQFLYNNSKQIYLRNRSSRSLDVALVDRYGYLIDYLALEGKIQTPPSCFGTAKVVDATVSRDTSGNVSRVTDAGTWPSAITTTTSHTIGRSNVCTLGGNDLSVSNSVDISSPIVNVTTVAYTIGVLNKSCSGSIGGIVLTDSGLSSTNFSGLSTSASAGSVATSGAATTWTIGTLAAGASASLSVTGKARVLGSIATTARISAPTSGLINTGDDSDLETITARDYNYVGFELTGATLTEGTDTSYSARITSDVEASSRITVNYTVSGTAGAGDTDLPASGSVTIDPADEDAPTETSIDFAITNDATHEADKTITLRITSVTSADSNVRIDSAAQEMTLSLLDDDPAFITPGGFNAFETTTAGGAVSGVIKTKIAGQAFNLDLVALNTGASGVQTDFTGDVAVELVNAGFGTSCATYWSLGGASTVSFAAADNGRKRVSLSNNEAMPNVRVRLKYPATGATSVTACSTDNFALRPASLAGSARDADWTTAGSTRTLNVVTATGTPVHKAGRPFTLVATAYNAAGIVTNGYTGTPSVSLVGCVLPASGCSTGVLSAGAFSGSFGTMTSTTASYSEVGAISATLSDATFAAVDAADGSTLAERTVTSAAFNIGRFVPDHFDIGVNAPAFAPGCGGFTYLGQPFGFGAAPQWTVSARNSAGGDTLNYTGSLFKIAAGTVTGQAWSAASGTVSVVGSLPAASVTDLGGGQASLVFDVGNPAGGGGLAFTRTALTAPFDASLAFAASVADSEGVIHAGNPYSHSGIGFDDANAGTTTDAQMRFGRLRLANAVGSEMLALPVPLTAQYWNGQGFVTNTSDNCTAIAAPSLTFSADTADNHLASGETTASFNAVFVAGNGNLSLSAPGVGNFGFLDLTVVAPDWLKYNRDGVDQAGDGNPFDDNPRARAAFGKRKGSDKVIIRREIY